MLPDLKYGMDRTLYLIVPRGVFANVLTSGTLAPVVPLLVPVVKKKLVLLPQWPRSKWGPFSFFLVNKTLLLMLLAKTKSRKFIDHNCKQKLFVENENENQNLLVSKGQS